MEVRDEGEGGELCYLSLHFSGQNDSSDQSHFNVP